ncbi:MAG: RrF2 family transcriptional regulator [Acidobacteriota bacterium]
MKLPAKFRYAVRILIELGIDDRQFLSLSQVEKSQNISAKFAKQILQPLQINGLVEGKRGTKGGYYLKKSPREINLLNIYQALGEELKPAPCLDEQEDCGRVDYCGAKSAWEELHKLLLDFFKRMTIEDLMIKERSLRIR